jgi:hypothetical protein
MISSAPDRDGDRAASLGLGARRLPGARYGTRSPYVGSKISESRPNGAWPRSARAMKLTATALLGIVKPVGHADGPRPALRARGKGEGEGGTERPNPRKLWIPPRHSHRILAMQHRIATHYIHTPRTRRRRSTGCRATMTARLGIVWPLPGARAPSMAGLDRLAPQVERRAFRLTVQQEHNATTPGVRKLHHRLRRSLGHRVGPLSTAPYIPQASTPGTCPLNANDQAGSVRT